MTDTYGPPERRECIDCGNTRTLEFFTTNAETEICDDCWQENWDQAIEQDWGGDHIADTNQEKAL